MSFSVEKGIEPLVRALNELDFATTVYSCEGHFDGKQREMFLPTAYVTFDVSDVKKFSGLYEWLNQLSVQSETGRLRLTYDCILGRYTLSIWPRASSLTPRQKRESVDAAIALLADMIIEYAARLADAKQAILNFRPDDYLWPPVTQARTGASPSGGSGKAPVNPLKSLPPCQLSDSLSFPPCALVIPSKEVICPFLTLEERRESER